MGRTAAAQSGAAGAKASGGPPAAVAATAESQFNVNLPSYTSFCCWYWILSICTVFFFFLHFVISLSKLITL